MTTELFELQYTAGVSLYVAVFRVSDGHIFDWSDNTFKAFGSATTKTLAATELTNVGGTAKSLFKRAVDLALINNTSTPLDVCLNWFSNNTAADCVSHPLLFGIASGDIALEAATDGFAVAVGDASATPSPSSTRGEFLSWLLALLMNKGEQDTTEQRVYDSAGDLISVASVGSTGATINRQKFEDPSP